MAVNSLEILRKLSRPAIAEIAQVIGPSLFSAALVDQPFPVLNHVQRSVDPGMGRMIVTNLALVDREDSLGIIIARIELLKAAEPYFTS